MKTFISELRRRNVIRVCIAYSVFSWLIVQFITVVFPLMLLPSWTQTFVVLLLLIGLPIACVIAWAFELTPAGLVRTEVADDHASEEAFQSQAGARGLLQTWGAIGIIGIVLYLLIFRLVSDEQPLRELVTARVAEVPTIAVLPFLNLSSDPEQSYFSDGISEDLLNALVATQKLKVTSRTSSFSFRGKEVDVPTIAQSLNVKYLVDGSVRKSGTSVRISAQLIDTELDTPIWSQTYDRELRNLFEVQSSIASSIAGALHIKLLGSQDTDLRKFTSSEQQIAGYDHYLRGLQHLRKSSFSDLQAAQAELEKAISLTPALSQAHAALARTLLFSVLTGVAEPEDTLALAQRAAYKALDVDPGFGGAYAALGGIAYLRSDLYRAQVEYHRAEDLQSLGDNDHWLYANTLIDLGQLDRAQSLLKTAFSETQYSSSVHWARGLVFAAGGNLEQAEAAFERSLELVSGNPNVIWLQGLAQASLGGDLVSAIKLTRQAAEADPNDPEIKAYLALYLASIEDFTAASNMASEALAMAPGAAFSQSVSVLLRSLQGDSQGAVELSKSALSRDRNFRHSSDLVFLGNLSADETSESLPFFERLYPAILKQNNTTDLWSSTVLAAQAPHAFVAVALATELIKQGESGKATPLLYWVRDNVKPHQYWAFPGYQLLQAEVKALQGDSDAALEQLERAVDQGYILGWQWRLRDNPAFSGLKADQRFQTLIVRLKNRAATQRELLGHG